MYSYLYMYSDGPFEISYSGIGFCDFLDLLDDPIQNILLLKCEEAGEKYVHNFPIAEGKEAIAGLAQKRSKNGFGDFHFLDYAKPGAVRELTEEEIKNLLYLSHMRKPCGSPFFARLQNRFVYLSHDDGWSCKLYLKDPTEFLTAAAGKIEAYLNVAQNNGQSKNALKRLLRPEQMKTGSGRLPPLDAQTRASLFDHWQDGLWIDLSGAEIGGDGGRVNIYLIGRVQDMDDAFSQFERCKTTQAPARRLCFHGAAWTVL